MSAAGGRATIGVDVGGTHTDVAVLLGDRIARGKALTTHGEFDRGLLEAIEVAATELDLTLAELLGSCGIIINATTVVTNAVTEVRGSRVGVLVTAGFRDVFRLAGGPRKPVFDDHLQSNVPTLVPYEAIAEVHGRIDSSGAQIVAPREDEIRRQVDHLVNTVKVEALAVCFLNSYVNPDHELAAEKIIQTDHPELFVSLSHRVFPVMRETRRWTTAVLNSFVHAETSRYLDTVDARLRDAGFAGSLASFQGLGGGISKGRAAGFPLALLGSGPAAGALGANELAVAMGRKHVLLGDMGGTSFDTCLIRDKEPRITKNVELGPFQTGINLVDVTSVGAGGGSVVSVSERGVPLVGPRSAGSSPGPACYDRGGTEATVTDAMVALGFIDPDNYLGGRMRLSRSRAVEALTRTFAGPFGWSPEQSAASVHDLVVTNMANALHEVSVGKGHDPRDCLFLAYGGSLALFAWQIASSVGIGDVVIPANSSVFCAQGLLCTDFVVRHDRTVNWSLTDLEGLPRLQRVADEMVTRATREIAEDGFDESAVTVTRRGDFQFPGQVYELGMPLPDRLEPEDVPALAARFHELYARTYGAGAAFEGVIPILTNYTVEVKSPRPRQAFAVGAPQLASDGELRIGRRDIYLPSERRYVSVDIVDDARFTVGREVVGPVVIDASDTTIYVPPDVVATRDEFSSYRLTGGGR